MLAALAQATTRLRLGTLVTGIHHRHPAVLANMASAVDIISSGRLELGIGAGWSEVEDTAYGFELGTPAQRSDRFEEACEVLVNLLSRDTTTFCGTYYRLVDARNAPKGVQQPHPPLCVGGNGEKRTLRTAARFAQHWSFLGGTPQDFARKLNVLHAHCADLGRDPDDIVLSTPVIFEGDPVATAAAAAAFGAQGAQLAIIVLRPPFDPAVLEPIAHALREID